MNYSNQCLLCKNYTLGGTCLAFPDKIPYEIISGEFDHQNPFPNDRGVRFESVEFDNGNLEINLSTDVKRTLTSE